jgi:uncharacterized membrane protein
MSPRARMTATPLKGDETVWESEYSVEAPVTPESVWQVWADFENVASWDKGIESIELSGPFASGTEFSMKPAGGI